MKIAVHITHEVVKKIGGIGAVINGWCSSAPYKKIYGRTLLYGPVFGNPVEAIKEVSKTCHIECGRAWLGEKKQKKIDEVKRKYNIELIYGKKPVQNEGRGGEVDFLLVYVQNMHLHEVAKFKYSFWERFGISSDLYETNWDYEQYLRIAIPFVELIKEIYGEENEFHIFAHEYMGLPSALSVKMSGEKWRTVFVAHEISTARFIVESHPGHDISFYNILQREKGKRSLEEVFGSQRQNPRNELVKRADELDTILCVSDLVREEFAFLKGKEMEKAKIGYNGLSFKEITFDEKAESRKKVNDFLKKLLGFEPDVLFTHVARFVVSKGLWRDLTLLYYLDRLFYERGLKGAYILLSTLIATGRNPEDVLRMEREYKWPLNHKKGWPDLVGGEAEMWDYIQTFNQNSKSIKAIFINQFGFSREACGNAVPEGTDFIDLRIASDCEFGLSIYEPFGISHIEVLPYGGISVISSSCGVSFLLNKVFNEDFKPYLIIDFIKEGESLTTDELLNLRRERRDEMERRCIERAAEKVFQLLPITDEKRKHYLQSVKKYIPALHWDKIFPLLDGEK